MFVVCVSMVYVLHSFPVLNFHLADIFPDCFPTYVFQLSLFYPFIDGVARVLVGDRVAAEYIY